MIFSSKPIFVFLLIFNIVRAEPGDLISFNQRNSFSVEAIDLLLENFGPIAPSALYPIEVYDIEYESYNFDGSIDTLSGLVCIPQEPTKSFPIVVYNHGTIILDSQAPSITGLSVENFEILLAGLVTTPTGFITLFPDYKGIGDPGFHPYIIAEPHTLSVVNMLRSIEKLNQQGANILASGTRIEKLEELKSKYGNIKTLKFDISQSDKIEEFVEHATKELGGNLDCIVNNAGITQDNLAIRMSLDEWKKVIDVNLTSTFLMSKSAIKKMLKNKSGKIVNITSVVGHTGNLGQANYTASKAGIIAMSKSLAIEYAKKNININCISPGFIKTAMTDKLDDKFKEAIISKIPSARLGEPDDIANAVLFLCSSHSSYINGETLHVNGGMYMA